MKKIFFPLAACAMLSLAACNFSQTKCGGEDDTLLYSTIVYEDSAGPADHLAYQNINIDYPLKDDASPIADSLRAWLKQELSICCYPNVGEEGETVEEFKGDLRDGMALVSHYGRIGAEIMGKAMEPDSDEYTPLGYGNDYQGSITTQTPNYLTYTTCYSIYTGGAHGLYMVEEATFSRADGKRMGWNLIDTIAARPALMQCLQEGILEYFNADMEEKQTLRDFLFAADLTDLPDDSLLALPGTAPSLTEKGVSFVYQQYEIAAYCFGLPSCIIPYEKAKAFLTPEGKRLAGL